MKKKVLLFLAAASLAFMTSSCAVVGGVVYDGHTNPHSVTSNTISKNAKVGTSSFTNILGLVCIGDGGINAAAKTAGITKISHVDQKNLNVLGIFSKVETVVYGE
jgi:hypothetical protein